MRLPLPLHTYRPQSSARLLNWYAEAAPVESKAPVQLIRCPGVKTASAPAIGAGRGVFNFKETLYSVTGTSLISTNSAGASTTLGIIPGISRVTFASNATQLAICADDNVYVWDGSAITQVQTGISTIDGIDGYIVGAKSDATGQFVSSAIQDALTWDALFFATAEGSSDPLIGLIVDHREVLLGGTRTVEAWYNAGGSAFPFERSPSTGVIELGLAAGQSFAKQDNSTFWLASDLTVRRLSGATPARVSHHGVEQAIRSYADVTTAYAFSYAWNGHLFYTLTFPGVATWEFDATTGEWHERASEGANDWEVVGAAECYQRVYVQRRSDGMLGYLTGDSCAEFDGTYRTDDIETGAVYRDTKRICFDSIELRYRTEKQQTGSQASPSVTLYKSIDGGDNFVIAGLSASKSLGLIGEKPRVNWLRLGSSREMSFRFRFSNANPTVIEDASVSVTLCRS